MLRTILRSALITVLMLLALLLVAFSSSYAGAIEFEITAGAAGLAILLAFSAGFFTGASERKSANQLAHVNG